MERGLSEDDGVGYDNELVLYMCHGLAGILPGGGGTRPRRASAPAVELRGLKNQRG